MDINFSESSLLFFKKAKITNSILSATTGDDKVLIATDLISAGLDVIEILKPAIKILGPIGGITSFVAIEQRILGVYKDLTDDIPKTTLKTSTVISIASDLIGIISAAAPIAGPAGIAASQLLLLLSATVGALGNLVQSIENNETELAQLSSMLEEMDTAIFSKQIFTYALGNFNSFSEIFNSINSYFTKDEVVLITEGIWDGENKEVVIKKVPSDQNDAPYEIVTESKLISIQDAINYAIQYDIKGVTVDSILKLNIENGTKYKDEIHASDYDDVIKTSAGDDLITGGGGHDSIFGEDGSDTLYGNDGCDKIYGGSEDDFITGGIGNDILVGEDGSDTYIFNSGDGKDKIYTSDSNDIIQINGNHGDISHGSGSNLYDLIIKYGTSDSITVKNFYLGGGLSMIDKLIGKNGTIDKESLISAGLSLVGSGGGYMQGINGYENKFTTTSGSYKIVGGNLKDQFSLAASSGHTVLAGNGDDHISLSGGVNHINGGDGNDYYALGAGTYYILDTQINGQLNLDKIHVTKNINTSNIEVEKIGSDMVIKIGDGDSITILNWYSSSGYKIEKFTYDSGYASKSLTWQQLEEMAKEKEAESPEHKIKEMFNEKFKDDFFANLKQLVDEEFDSPVRPRDPLVIDLNGDGVNTVGTNLNVHFDHDGDGNKEQTGWISDSDGFVVLDKNGNGLIDNGTEMFGENTLIENGDNANDGYQALAHFDANADGKIDANDSIFSELKIWNDRNYNGVSEADELLSLTDLGIKSISVIGTSNGLKDSSGNTIVKTGTVEFENGTVGISNSLGFTTNEFSVDENGKIIIDEKFNGIKDIEPIGFARSLLESGTLSKTLGDLITQFKNAGSRTERESITQQILVAWAKTSEYKDLYERIAEFSKTILPPHGPQNTYEQGQVTSMWDKLAIVEVFSGKTLSTVKVNMFSGFAVAEPVIEFYEKIHDYVYSSLTDSVRLHEYKKAAFIDADSGHVNMDALLAVFDESYSNNPLSAIEDLLDFNNLYKNELSTENSNINELILSKISNLEITEQIKVSLSDMGYHFVNSGTLNIDTYSSNSSIINHTKPKIAAGNDNNNTMSVNGDNAVIYGFGGDDVISSVNQGTQTIFGGSGNDIIDSGYGPDIIFGGDGNDTIGNGSTDKAGSIGHYGPSLNQFFGNTVTGGKGNDTIYGSVYGDIYHFNKGDGQDSIIEFFGSDKGTIYTDKLYLGEGISKNDLLITSVGNDVIISIANSNDKITLKEYLNLNSYGGSSELEEIHFFDGSIINASYIKSLALNKTGDEGDNKISGNANKLYSETISGLGGNDILHGNAGNDTIYGGDGNDAINGGTEQDYLYGENGDDTIAGGLGNDFIDGGAGNDTINGDEGADTLNGGDGDDIIRAGAADASGGDKFIGGRGDDKLYGSGNGDKYYFSQGDGKDTIYEVSSPATDESNTDRLIFSDTILKENVVLTVSGLDLIITFTNSTDKITVINQFADTFNGNRDQKIDEILFSDGTVWNASEITSRGMVTIGTDGDDTIHGNGSPVFSDTIYGGSGDDKINGYAGSDTLYGESGNDTIFGGQGNDIIDGGTGNDVINGDEGTDILSGGDGDDIIRTGTAAGNSGDTITGGRGDDTLYGSSYGDKYHFSLGDGKDTIYEVSQLAIDDRTTDRLIFADTILKENVLLGVSGLDLIITFKNSTDKITVINQFADTYNGNRDQKIDEILFSDGTVWNAVDIASKGNATFGTDGNDTIYGNNSPSFSETIFGGAGDDFISSYAGADTLYGEAGNDTLIGGSEADILDGGDGDDTLDGGYGPDKMIGGRGNDIIGNSLNDMKGTNSPLPGGATFYGNNITGGEGDDTIYGSIFGDIYNFELGDGKDTITEYNTTSSGDLYSDRLIFGHGISVENIQVERSGNDLIAHIGQADDTILIKSWNIVGMRIEKFEFEDGQILDSSQFENLTTHNRSPMVSNQTMDNLIQSMSAFDANIGVEGASIQAYQESQHLILASPQ